MGDLVAFVVTAAAAGLFTGIVYRVALSRALLDVPNERSSHTTPTPRGGGLGLLGALLLALVLMTYRQLDSALLGAISGVVLAAAVGWIDDHRSLGVRVRLAAHLIAGLSLLPLALGSPMGTSGLVLLTAGWWVFWGVSSINVVNFMDGIDGLIGVQALVYGGYLALLGSPGAVAHTAGLVLAGAAVGFLIWNWPPARIFMGDVGSGALGLYFVLGGILLISEDGVGLVVAYLPLYAIFLDASVTLVRRRWRGERVTEAHRTHLYQRLANGGWGHARVSVLYGVVAMLAIPVALLPATLLKSGVAGYFLGVLLLGFVLDKGAARSTN